MTAIASLASSVLAQTQASQQASSGSAEGNSPAQAAAAPQATPSSSTTVSITQIQAAALSTYAIPAPQPVWETNAVDGISKTMAQNFSSSTVSGRLHGLGQIMLEQLGGGGNDFSQSVYLPSTNAVPSATLAGAMQSALHTGASNQVSLSIAMRDGAQVTLTLSDQANGLAAAIAVTGGTLSDADRSALLKMAGGFQDAIDGLASSNQPTLDLDGLVQQFNSSTFSSLDLHASIDPNGQGVQTVDFHADGTQRSVKTTGPLGSMQISVDMSNPAILGSASQQAQAIDSYLQQFAAAGTRGHGNAQLISMFSAAFKSLNSHYDAAPSYASTSFSSAAHSMMTGLADFTASMTQATQSINPMKSDEVDSFSYQVSQNTTEQTRSRYDYTITQTQQSQLHASYHAPLHAGDSLALDGTKASQNYYYYVINDSAQSQATISYAKGKLVGAMLSQSASASMHVQKYVMGTLEEDITTPGQHSWSQDLLGLLNSTLQNTAGSQTVLDGVHSMIGLPTSPSQLADKIG